MIFFYESILFCHVVFSTIMLRFFKWSLVAVEIFLLFSFFRLLELSKCVIFVFVYISAPMASLRSGMYKTYHKTLEKVKQCLSHVEHDLKKNLWLIK